MELEIIKKEGKMNLKSKEKKKFKEPVCKSND